MEIISKLQELQKEALKQRFFAFNIGISTYTKLQVVFVTMYKFSSSPEKRFYFYSSGTEEEWNKELDKLKSVFRG